MILSIVITLFGGFVVMGGFVVILSLRKRLANQNPKLIGESAQVETALTPEGTVIVGGELWPAQSMNGASIPSQSLVRIVGVQDLALLVEACL